MDLEQTEMFTRQDEQNHTYGAAACDKKCGLGRMGTVNLCLKFGEKLWMAIWAIGSIKQRPHMAYSS